MLNPFQRTHTDDERRSLWERLTSPSEEEQREAQVVLSEARLFLEWYGMPYMKRYMKWVEEQAHHAVPIGEPLMMVSAATRANTFREIIQHLEHLEAKARVALGDD